MVGTRDPTFVFTHKSFGEYLTARRVVRAIERVIRELVRRETSPDEGRDERDALKHWTEVCGPTAISRYLHAFLPNALCLRDPDEVDRWQRWLTVLFSDLLRSGCRWNCSRSLRFGRCCSSHVTLRRHCSSS